MQTGDIVLRVQRLQWDPRTVIEPAAANDAGGHVRCLEERDRCRSNIQGARCRIALPIEFIGTEVSQSTDATPSN